MCIRDRSGNLNSVSFVRFDFAKGIIIKILDKLWVNGTNEKICFGKLMGKDFVIASGMLHYNSGPVSYTHLKITCSKSHLFVLEKADYTYKNTVIRQAGQPTHLPAVSYTHLDVYKRQLVNKPVVNLYVNIQCQKFS